MPRPKRLSVHAHFRPADQGAYQTARIVCKYCNWTGKCDATRQAKHLASCDAFRRLDYLNWKSVHDEVGGVASSLPETVTSTPRRSGAVQANADETEVISPTSPTVASSGRLDIKLDHAMQASVSVDSGQPKMLEHPMLRQEPQQYPMQSSSIRPLGSSSIEVAANSTIGNNGGDNASSSAEDQVLLDSSAAPSLDSPLQSTYNGEYLRLQVVRALAREGAFNLLDKNRAPHLHAVLQEIDPTWDGGQIAPADTSQMDQHDSLQVQQKSFRDLFEHEFMMNIQPTSTT